jgi:hypothetical protein
MIGGDRLGKYFVSSLRDAIRIITANKMGTYSIFFINPAISRCLNLRF